MGTESVSNTPRHRFRATLFWCTAGLFPCWVTGQIARDATWLTGLCFYIPSPALAALLLAWAAFLATRRQWALAFTAATMSIAPLVVTQFVENHGGGRVEQGTAASTSQPLRLVHWNLWGKLRPHCAQRVLQSLQADIYVLSEIPDVATVEEFRASLAEAHGAEFAIQAFGNLAAVARGTLRSSGWPTVRDGVCAQKVEWEFSQQRLRVLVVDLPANPLLHRDPMLREVCTLVEEHRPDLIVGDFNAPRRSRALSSLPAGYRHAYDDVGNDWSATWPVPVPLYAIDQCLYAPDIFPLQYQLHTSTCSDHRAQIFDFAVRSSASPW